jgi:hypothetical protein
MSYIILRGCWYDILVNVHAQTEDKIDHVKGSFYKELWAEEAPGPSATGWIR